MTATGWDKFNRIANLLIDPVGRVAEYVRPSKRIIDSPTGQYEDALKDGVRTATQQLNDEELAEFLATFPDPKDYPTIESDVFPGLGARYVETPTGVALEMDSPYPQGWERVKAEFNAPAGERSLFDLNKRSLATIPMSAALYYGGYSMLTPDERRQYPQQEY